MIFLATFKPFADLSANPKAIVPTNHLASEEKVSSGFDSLTAFNFSSIDLPDMLTLLICAKGISAIAKLRNTLEPLKVGI